MNAAALPSEELNKQPIINKSISTKEKLRNTLTDELILAVCSPIGSLREDVIETLTNILKNEYKYEVFRIKLSDFIKQYASQDDSPIPGQTNGFTFLMNKITGGDQLRTKYGPSILAELAIKEIHVSRHNDGGDPTPIELLKSRRTCFIIDSLKNKEELEVLRELYKDIFYCFSVFSPRNEREDNLLKKGLSKEEVGKVINTDDFENNNHGQNVRNTFVEGDFFIRVSKENIDQLKDKIIRYLSIIFESQIVTPNAHEIAMYEAQSAAGNSACLSRQVGAAVTNEKGEIISRGWNDVPKVGGNLYKEGEEKDERCKQWGYCSNDKTKDVITDEILQSLLYSDEVSEIIPTAKKIEKGSSDYEALKFAIRKNTRIKDLIEFSRAVHAEMHAIITGSQLAGSKMIGGKLFCTTYPCHNCARHIIVAGIKEIYYIEPYTKSLGVPLHSDSLSENENDIDKVRLLVYDGVAPRRYLEFFLMTHPRKDKTGKMSNEFPNNTNPKTRLSLQALPTLEQQAIHSLNEKGFFDGTKI